MSDEEELERWAAEQDEEEKDFEGEILINQRDELGKIGLSVE